MAQALEDKDQAPDADVALTKARDVAWVEWAALVQAPAQGDNVSVRRAALPSRIRSARLVITPIARNAAGKWYEDRLGGTDFGGVPDSNNLDAVMAKDPLGRVACETLVTTGLALISGEITTDS
jgi:hypothetical protein